MPPDAPTSPILLRQVLQQDIRLHLGCPSRCVFPALRRLLDRSHLQVRTRAALAQLAR